MLEDDRTSIALEVVTSDTTEDVKVKIQNKTGIPMDQQLLFVGTNSLEDGYMLGYYHIQAGDTICLIRRQRGMTLILRVCWMGYMTLYCSYIHFESTASKFLP